MAEIAKDRVHVIPPVTCGAYGDPWDQRERDRTIVPIP